MFVLSTLLMGDAHSYVTSYVFSESESVLDINALWSSRVTVDDSLLYLLFPGLFWTLLPFTNW